VPVPGWRVGCRVSLGAGVHGSRCVGHSHCDATDRVASSVITGTIVVDDSEFQFVIQTRASGENRAEKHQHAEIESRSDRRSTRTTAIHDAIARLRDPIAIREVRGQHVEGSSFKVKDDRAER
jgi:hypothetical protein